MKELLKNQAGAVIVVVILVLVLATAGGGAAFLTVRMVVSGDGNFLKPFEDLGWIDSDDDSSEDKEDKVKDKNDDKDNKKTDKSDKKDDKKDTKKTSSSSKKKDYLVEDSRLSSDAKKSGTEHYYGAIDFAKAMGDVDDEYAELYKLIKAGVNLYAKDGKVVEIAIGIDISDFCKEAYEQFASEFDSEEFESEGIGSAEDLQDMMMSIIETMYTQFDEEYSEYVKKYVDDGNFQLYITEKGFESLYETYDIEEGENDIDTFIDALEDSFSTKIELVK